MLWPVGGNHGLGETVGIPTVFGLFITPCAVRNWKFWTHHQLFCCSITHYQPKCFFFLFFVILVVKLLMFGLWFWCVYMTGTSHHQRKSNTLYMPVAVILLRRIYRTEHNSQRFLSLKSCGCVVACGWQPWFGPFLCCSSSSHLVVDMGWKIIY